MKRTDGSYADLVFFESQEDAERVLAAEQNSPAFFALMDPHENHADLGVKRFHHLKIYERRDGA